MNISLTNINKARLQKSKEREQWDDPNFLKVFLSCNISLTFQYTVLLTTFTIYLSSRQTSSAVIHLQSLCGRRALKEMCHPLSQEYPRCTQNVAPSKILLTNSPKLLKQPQNFAEWKDIYYALPRQCIKLLLKLTLNMFYIRKYQQ